MKKIKNKNIYAIWLRTLGYIFAMLKGNKAIRLKIRSHEI